MGLPRPRRIDPVRQSPRLLMFGSFTHGKSPPNAHILTVSLCRHPPPPPLPPRKPLRFPIARRAAFTALQVPRSGPTTDAASLAFSLSLIGSLITVPPANCASS